MQWFLARERFFVGQDVTNFDASKWRMGSAWIGTYLLVAQHDYMPLNWIQFKIQNGLNVAKINIYKNMKYNLKYDINISFIHPIFLFNYF